MDVSMIPIFIMVSTMIELSSKLKNIIFWVSTASISLIVFGVFVIDIFVTDAHGKDKLSIIFSYLSTIFAFLSSLALFATIGVYFWQKNDEKNKQNETNAKLCYFLSEKIAHLQSLIKFVKMINNEKIKITRVMLNGSEITIYSNNKKSPECHDLYFTYHDEFIQNNKILGSLRVILYFSEVEIISDEVISIINSYTCASHKSDGQKKIYYNKLHIKHLMEKLNLNETKLNRIKKYISSLH
ncbi:hypothetical protein ACFYLL_13210 [Proteus mirabilis]|uniref:hypothetical protein n=1 Tax=Proteus mirabilis TaxID=584 RepID=UPI0036831971|nr:hypothetical protein [Proteus mirabilis]